MKNSILLLAFVALAAVAFVGCGGDSATSDVSTTAVSSDGTAHAAVTPAVYCGKCGQAKGTELCCKADAETCASCNLHKGSALCCKISTETAGSDLCGKCGQVAGSDVCCAEGTEICAKCNLQKGSPLCCKLTAKEHEHTDDEGSES